MAKTKIPLKCV